MPHELDLPTHFYFLLPVVMGSAVRTRSGPWCLWHASHMENWTHNLGVLYIGFKLLPEAASPGSGIAALRDQLSVNRLHWDQGLCNFFFPSGIRTLVSPPPPLNIFIYLKLFLFVICLSYSMFHAMLNLQPSIRLLIKRLCVWMKHFYYSPTLNSSLRKTM